MDWEPSGRSWETLGGDRSLGAFPVLPPSASTR
jgi:hypothetical protein